MSFQNSSFSKNMLVFEGVSKTNCLQIAPKTQQNLLHLNLVVPCSAFLFDPQPTQFNMPKKVVESHIRRICTVVESHIQRICTSVAVRIIFCRVRGENSKKHPSGYFNNINIPHMHMPQQPAYTPKKTRKWPNWRISLGKCHTLRLLMTFASNQKLSVTWAPPLTTLWMLAEKTQKTTDHLKSSFTFIRQRARGIPQNKQIHCLFRKISHDHWERQNVTIQNDTVLKQLMSILKLCLSLCKLSHKNTKKQGFAICPPWNITLKKPWKKKP